MLLLLIANFVLILIFWNLYLRFSYNGRLIAKIPSPKSLPILGHTLSVICSEDALFRYLRSIHKEMGNFISLHSFHFNVINMYEPDDVETLLSSSRYNTKVLPYIFLKPWFGDGLLISNGNKWQHRRKMLTPAFHLKMLKTFTQTFNESTEKFLKKVEIEANKAQTDLLPLIADFTLKVMYDTSMGTISNDNINSDSKKYFDAVHVLGQYLFYRIARVWLHFNFLFSISKAGKIQAAALKDLHKVTNKIIKDRKEYRKFNKNEFTGNDGNIIKKSRLAMLDLLLEEENHGRINENGIRSEVDTFLFEGHDTTASALCFMIMRLANEKEIQNKIFEEMNRIFGDSERSPTIDDLNEMKYLELCIKESLRLYPSVPAITRENEEEVTLSGYKVPRNTTCIIHIYDIHRREDLYPEPEKFIPERFLPENCDKRHPFAYIPFSAGPRNCIGQKFVMLEMKTVMSGLLRRYSLEPITTPRDLNFVIHMVLRTKEAVYVRFCSRKKYF